MSLSPPARACLFKSAHTLQAIWQHPLHNKLQVTVMLRTLVTHNDGWFDSSFAMVMHISSYGQEGGEGGGGLFKFHFEVWKVGNGYLISCNSMHSLPHIKVLPLKVVPLTRKEFSLHYGQVLHIRKAWDLWFAVLFWSEHIRKRSLWECSITLRGGKHSLASIGAYFGAW